MRCWRSRTYSFRCVFLASTQERTATAGGSLAVSGKPAKVAADDGPVAPFYPDNLSISVAAMHVSATPAAATPVHPAVAAVAAERRRVDANAALAAMPPGWEQRTEANSGRTFYVCHHTRTTQWTAPTAEQVAEAYRHEALVAETTAASRTARAADELPFGWERRVTNTGKPYFVGTCRVHFALHSCEVMRPLPIFTCVLRCVWCFLQCAHPSAVGDCCGSCLSAVMICDSLCDV